ncbi:MAG: phosphoadenylyl-sulfate reductase, partial [Planctomycetes bacterium]|nr:phosphoadenylyl-sulfate reductase [Planctomycetota bacterium]
MARFTQADLIELNKAFEDRTPAELLRWTKVVFGQRVAALSAMQMAGSVICHMMSTLKLDIKVVFVDTGVNFQETLDTRDRIGREYGLEIVTLHPAKTMEEQTQEFGVLYLTAEGQKHC